jgi:hypothetical protein
MSDYQPKPLSMLSYEKRRKVASVAYDSFTATYRTMQIGKPRMAGETRHPRCDC